MSNQWLAKKTIDQIRAQAEGMPLQRALGRWSLAMFGIAATIGAGIFALTGTAAAGESSQPSMFHAQIIDVLLNFVRHGSLSGTVMHGRPPAGPSVVISFALCAIVCGLVGLCYAELASMIPFAGGAYNYAYVSIGEVFAWLAGWGLILEFAIGNVAVVASFAGYLREELTVMHLTLPETWSTPVWQAGHFTGSYFNIPAFLIIFLLTLLLIRGVKESARATKILVAIKIVAIVVFLAVGARAVSSGNLDRFAPSHLPGILGAAAVVFFTYIGFDP